MLGRAALVLFFITTAALAYQESGMSNQPDRYAQVLWLAQ